jgi:hypothetical protein
MQINKNILDKEKIFIDYNKPPKSSGMIRNIYNFVNKVINFNKKSKEKVEKAK